MASTMMFNRDQQALITKALTIAGFRPGLCGRIVSEGSALLALATAGSLDAPSTMPAGSVTTLNTSIGHHPTCSSIWRD